MTTWTNHVENEDILMQRALKVDPSTLGDLKDDDGAPVDGNAYLARVQKEAEQFKDVLVAGKFLFC